VEALDGVVAVGGHHPVPGQQEHVLRRVRLHRLAAPVAVVRPFQLKNLQIKRNNENDPKYIWLKKQRNYSRIWNKT